MPLFRALVTLKADNNVAADHSTNSLHFNIEADTPGGDTESERADEVMAAIRQFYLDIFSGDRSTLMAQSNHEIQLYDLTEPSPRLPKYMLSFGIPAPTDGTLPAEVAAVASFQGPKTAGVPQARRRNRIYLGPLPEGALDSTTGLMNATWAGNVRDAMKTLSDTSAGDNGWRWDIYSPTDSFNGVIADGWVNNEFDTQRRRGRSATVRYVWTGPSD